MKNLIKALEQLIWAAKRLNIKNGILEHSITYAKSALNKQKKGNNNEFTHQKFQNRKYKK
jgi:hypothetical protein